MPDFRSTLAKQQAERSAMLATQQHNLQTTQTLHPHSNKTQPMGAPGSSAVNTLPMPDHPAQRYPIQTISQSNQLITNADFIYDIYALHEFQNLAEELVQLFSDGVYRVLKSERGVVSHTPAFVRSA